MIETKYYTVTQEREVKISANSVYDAFQIAKSKFDNTPANPHQSGQATTSVHIRALVVREDY